MEERTLEAKVESVTVQEDRAHVVRRAKIVLPIGLVRLRVDGVSPVLVDKTLFAKVSSPATGCRVSDVRAVREQRAMREQRGETIAKLEAEKSTVDAQARANRGAEATARDALVALQQTAQLTFAEIGIDSSHGKSDRARWEADLRALSREEARLRADLVLRAADGRDLDRKLRDLEREIAERRNVGTETAAHLIVELVSEREATVELSIEYIVGNAVWRPYHTATFLDPGSTRAEPAKVKVRSDACVWQRTGEDWNDVELALSTERASLGTTPPLLESDVVASTKRLTQAVVVAQREQAVAQAGLGGVKVETAELPGIDDGGDPLVLRARSRASIPSDGRPYRFALFDMESDAEPSLVLCGEVTSGVIRKTLQHNRASQPLLAGPVDLVREGGYVGRARLLFVAPGEKFALGWGPDGALRAHREHEELKTETKLLSSWVTTPHRVTIHLSNLGADPRTVKVTERIPVSEIEKLKIDLDQTVSARGARIDQDGMVELTVSLPAHGHETVTVGYIVSKHSDVVGV